MAITKDQAKPGTKVILGKHVPHDPKKPHMMFWEPEMDNYVGHLATIEIDPINDSDPHGLYTVEVCENGYAWRIENMTLALTENDIKVGDKVILGKHMKEGHSGGSTNWSANMDQYVGQEATVDYIYSDDGYGIPYITVAENNYSWRIHNLTLSGELGAVQVSGPMGAICTVCGSKNDYLPVNPKHVCRICKEWKGHWS